MKIIIISNQSLSKSLQTNQINYHPFFPYFHFRRKQEISEMTASLRKHNFSLGDESSGYNKGMYETGTYERDLLFFDQPVHHVTLSLTFLTIFMYPISLSLSPTPRHILYLT